MLFLLKSVYWNTGKLNHFLFLLDTCLKKLGSNEALTAAETTQSQNQKCDIRFEVPKLECIGK